MKILFISPVTTIWSSDLRLLGNMIEAEVVYLGDMIRSEIKSGTEIGNDFKSVIENGDLVSPELVCKLLQVRFFSDQANKILVHYPRSFEHAKYLSHFLKENNIELNALLVIDIEKKSLKTKLQNQYHCPKDYSHPAIETSDSSPVCSICNQPLMHTYELSNLNLKHTIESYYNEANGDLAAAKLLKRENGSKYINFTTPELVTSELCAK